MALLPQEVPLLPDSLHQNVAMHRDLSEEAIRNCSLSLCNSLAAVLLRQLETLQHRTNEGVTMRRWPDLAHEEPQSAAAACERFTAHSTLNTYQFPINVNAWTARVNASDLVQHLGSFVSGGTTDRPCPGDMRKARTLVAG